MVKALTDRALAGLRFRGRAENVFDTKTRGLVLRVGTRTKTWYFTYRNGGPTQWLKLGDYPDGLTLADARDRVATERARLVDGIDPVVEKAKPPVEPTPQAPVYTFADFVPVFVRFQKARTKY